MAAGASALHAGRPSIVIAYASSLALVDVLFWQNPLIAAAATAAILIAAVRARAWRGVAGAVRFALPLTALLTLVNVLVSSRGTTVLVRGFTLFGHRFDITLESLVWGLVTGLSVVAVVLAFALYAAAVDPDDLLRSLRRISYRSALTAALATRLVPVLARDARRIRDAARCRPSPPSRLELTRAALTGTLERAVDVAAALEVRGYSAARPPTLASRPWSRHDVRLALVAALVAAAAIAAKVAGAGAAHADPTVAIAAGPEELALSAIVIAAGALPFAGRGARLGVRRG